MSGRFGFGLYELGNTDLRTGHSLLFFSFDASRDVLPGSEIVKSLLARHLRFTAGGSTCYACCQANKPSSSLGSSNAGSENAIWAPERPAYHTMVSWVVNALWPTAHLSTQMSRSTRLQKYLRLWLPHRCSRRAGPDAARTSKLWSRPSCLFLESGAGKQNV